MIGGALFPLTLPFFVARRLSVAWGGNSPGGNDIFLLYSRLAWLAPHDLVWLFFTIETADFDP